MSQKTFSLDIVSVELRKERKLLSEWPVNTVETAVELLQDFLEDRDREHICAVYLRNDMKPICMSVIAIGTVSIAVTSPREILKAAILTNASYIMLLHNHPTGNPAPSEPDLALTKKIAKAGELMEIPLVDHIIIGRKCKYSFMENGLLPRVTNPILAEVAE